MTNNQSLSYRTDALQQLITMFHIPPTRISKLMGQTNNITINRWLEGRDIYTSALVNLCNMLGFDLLSFFTYQGQAIQTTLADIARMEQSGLTLRSLLEEKGIAPDENTSAVQLKPVEHPAKPSAAQILPTDLLDRIITIQCNAHEHERQMLEQQRRDLQSIIDDKDNQIAALQKELNRMKKQRTATTPYFGVVADDSELGDK